MGTKTEQRPTPRVRRLRRFSRWTQRDLANQLGVSVSRLGRWERGEAPIPESETAYLSDFYGVSVEHLLGLT